MRRYSLTNMVAQTSSGLNTAARPLRTRKVLPMVPSLSEQASGSSWWSPSMLVMLAVGGLTFDLWTSQKEHLWRWLQELWWTRVEIRSAQHRDMCDALLFWCAQRSASAGSHNLSVAPPPVNELTTPADTPVQLAFGYGRHVLRHPTPGGKARTIIFSRDVDDSMKHKQGLRHGGNAVEDILTLTTSGSDGREVISSVLHEAMEDYNRALKGRAKVYCNDGGYWEQLCWRQYRRRDTMLLTPSQTQALDDVQKFIDSQSPYAALGVPWRRGYLLQGPPGTGKSSFISVAAGVVHAPMYILSLKDPQLNDASLLRAVNSVPSGSFLILEDIDTVASGVDGTAQQSSSALSLSGLLNAIDGIAASEGRVLMMTANRPEVLPAALLRPGRIDEVITFTHLQPDEAQIMAQRFHGALPLPPAGDAPLSAAVIQHALLQQTVYNGR